MKTLDIHLCKKLTMLGISLLFLSHLAAVFFRYSNMPEWVTLIQGAIFFICFLFILYWVLTKIKLLQNHIFCKILILVIFISRGIIAIINEHYPLLPNLSDVSYYHQLGLDYSRELLIQGSGIGAAAFGNYFIGILYLIIGASPVIISLLNAFIYSLTILILIKICSELKFNNYWIVPFGACILPSSFLYIPVMLRESLFLLCAISFFYQMIILFGKGNKGLFKHMIVIVLLLLCTLIRPQVFPIFLLIYVFTLIYYQRGFLKVLSCLLLASIIILISFSNLTLFQFIDSDLLNLYYFQMYRNAFSDLPNAYLVNIAYKDWLDFVSYLPRFILYFLFAPFPWVAANYKYFMATLDSMITIIIITSTVFVVFYNYKNWKKHLLPAVMGICIFVLPFAMIEAYPMGAVRHRMIVTLMMLPLLAGILPQNMGIPSQKNEFQ